MRCVLGQYKLQFTFINCIIRLYFGATSPTMNMNVWIDTTPTTHRPPFALIRPQVRVVLPQCNPPHQQIFAGTHRYGLLPHALSLRPQRLHHRAPRHGGDAARHRALAHAASGGYCPGELSPPSAQPPHRSGRILRRGARQRQLRGAVDEGAVGICGMKMTVLTTVGFCLYVHELRHCFVWCSTADVRHLFEGF